MLVLATCHPKLAIFCFPFLNLLFPHSFTKPPCLTLAHILPNWPSFFPTSQTACSPHTHSNPLLDIPTYHGRLLPLSTTIWCSTSRTKFLFPREPFCTLMQFDYFGMLVAATPIFPSNHINLPFPAKHLKQLNLFPKPCQPLSDGKATEIPKKKHSNGKTSYRQIYTFKLEYTCLCRGLPNPTLNLWKQKHILSQCGFQPRF